MATASVTNPFAGTEFERRKVRRLFFNKWLMFAFCLILVIPLVAILVDIFIKAAPVLSLDYLWANPENKGKAGGIWAPLVGTFYLVIGSLLFVAPVGILAAIYLNEYAKEGWVNRTIGITVTSLAGVPSIVHGLFGLGAFVLVMLPAVNGALHLTENKLEAGLLTASLTIAVMNLPVVITSTREALGAVPQSFREACWNLGATRWQTIRTIVLPNSFSGILTGIILVVSRAAGETAPILFTGVTFFKFVADEGWAKLLPYNPGEPFMAMSMHLNIISNQISKMPDDMKFGSAAVLIGLILFVNSFAIVLRVWLRVANAGNAMTNGHPHIEFRDLSAFYGSKQVLKNVSFTVPRNTVIGIIGPANSGKTTLLKTINRTLDFIGAARSTGDVLISGQSVGAMRDPNELRRRIGMVFPLPVGLPLTIYENVAYAPRRRGVTAKAELEEIVERCLRQSVLWDEVKDRLQMLGTRLSGGQQQRLTLARALSLSPEILCLDEFSIAIDPVTTMRIEDVLKELRKSMTIVLVTNLVQQARRLADNTLFLWRGEIVELSPTDVAFSDTPKDKRTYEYVNGIFG